MSIAADRTSSPGSRAILQRDHGRRRGRQTSRSGPSARGDGRTVHAINQPMPDGGWVSTHEDVTEQQKLQKQRDDMAKQQRRRGAIDTAIAAFRTGMETLLKTFGDSAAAMKSTATTLSAASNHTAQSATSAVAASQRGLDRRQVAADATDELAEFDCRNRAPDHADQQRRALAVDEAQATNGEMTTLAVIGAEDRRHRQAHPDHRRADQPARAQRHDRSGARRRRGPRLCGGGLRGQIAGGADRQGDRSDRRANPRRAELDHERRRIRSAASPSACRRSSTTPPASPPRSSSRTPLRQHLVQCRERRAGDAEHGARCSTTSPAPRRRPTCRPKSCSTPRARWKPPSPICAGHVEAFLAGVAA